MTVDGLVFMPSSVLDGWLPTAGSSLFFGTDRRGHMSRLQFSRKRRLRKKYWRKYVLGGMNTTRPR